jgi:TPR repeat protein
MIPKHFLVASLLSIASAPVSAQSVKAGIEAWQHADYARAVSIWRPLAESGDADAQFNLGQAYRLGRGVTINLGAAKTWFERAAAGGHLDAQTTLGLLLFQNGDQQQGLKWLRRSADKGEPRALLVYGTALYNGDAVTQDRLLGYAFVSRAAQQGLGPAKETLEQLDGLMSAADREKALVLARSIPSGAPKAISKPVKSAQAAPSKTSPPKAVPPKALPARNAAPRPSSPATGNWRIQLGAFTQRGSAEAMYRRVAGRPALAGRGPVYVAAGNVIRLQVGPFVSREAAASACATLGTACFPVPKG